MLCATWRGEWSYFNSMSKMKQQYEKSPILIFIYRHILDSSRQCVCMCKREQFQQRKRFRKTKLYKYTLVYKCE